MPSESDGRPVVTFVCTGGRDPDGVNRHDRIELASFGEDGHAPAGGLILTFGDESGRRISGIEWGAVRWATSDVTPDGSPSTGGTLACPPHEAGGCGRNLTVTTTRLFRLITAALDAGIPEVDISRVQ